MSRSHIRWAVVLTVIALLMLAAPALAKGPGGGGKPAVETTNNLSFPAIAVDGFTPSSVADDVHGAVRG